MSTPISVWDPSKQPGHSSLRNTPDATPDTSLRGGRVYISAQEPSFKRELPPSGKGVIWTEFSAALGEVAASRHQLLSKTHLATSIDDRDKSSPDSWVPRHEALVRLTGKHPFNCEPPIGMLLDQGFITPVSLHYVRNHGKCPNLAWDQHRLSISGLVKKELTFTMEDLTALPKITIPVTLVCAGNRRKEENMIRQTIGFSWGCAAHACNMWTGVRLADLLQLCGIDRDTARHVCFVGPEREGLPNGTYGTSIDIATAMDPYGEVLIAYEQNGVRLAPDHGFPLRVVIPGWIGGRMVKWLQRIEVTDKPSENYYHFFDNRILPPHVDAELAKAEGWWYKPEYLFNQLNINSAIVYPANGETLTLTGAGVYTIKGYAYSGGGRKVTRVEISLDGGITWLLCKLDYPEERYSHTPKFGRYYCWMFWEYTIDKFMFLNAATGSGEIRCRAWDESSNSQPKDITWNLMGMGNNCHFTVKVKPRQSSGSFVLEFLHPTVPGPTPGGWMPPPKPVTAVVTGPAPSKSPSAPALSSMVKTYTLKEVAKHNSEESAWIVVDGQVYDATPYLEDHPGGAASIVMNAGEDATEEFLAIHSEKAKKMLEDYYIGEVADADQAATEAKPKSMHISKSSAQLLRDDLPNQQMKDIEKAEYADDLVALNPKKWVDFELIKKTHVSHDTRLFKFKLQSPQHRLGLPVGYHMFIQAVIDGKLVMRAYTPVSSDDDVGHFTLCIKVYFKNVHPKFPDGGKMSQYMESMLIGDMLKVKGPLGHFEYRGDGNITVKGKERFATKIGLICGGTGLTPAYQVMQAVYKDKGDPTEVYLLYANQTEGDILMREELDQMAERDNIHVWYTLDRAPEGWKYSTGFIDEKMVRQHIPAAGDESFVGMCGPPPMIKFACVPNLEKVGYTTESYMQF